MGPVEWQEAKLRGKESRATVCMTHTFFFFSFWAPAFFLFSFYLLTFMRLHIHGFRRLDFSYFETYSENLLERSEDKLVCTLLSFMASTTSNVQTI